MLSMAVHNEFHCATVIFSAVLTVCRAVCPRPRFKRPVPMMWLMP